MGQKIVKRLPEDRALPEELPVIDIWVFTHKDCSTSAQGEYKPILSIIDACHELTDD
jgi:hypothetical protein